MASLNRISLIGNVGRDPEIKDFQGNKVASFSLAVNEKVIRSDGYPPEEKVLWFRVTFWGNTADIVEKFVKKGSQVYIDGKLSTSDFLDKEGRSRTSLEVRGQTLTLLGTGGLGGAYSPTQQEQNGYNTNSKPLYDQTSKTDDAQMEQPPIDNESELPF
ncbi:MAG: single-stranded DNA-binding protein [Bacteroidetes bacterium]|nr:MAG: single-stranded DNA-binding protein [Bacteroidota bacterium]